MANRTKNQTHDRVAVSPDRVIEKDDGHYLNRLIPRGISSVDLIGVVAGVVILTSSLLYAPTRPIPSRTQAELTIRQQVADEPLESIDDRDMAVR